MFLHCRILSAHVGAEADDADGGDAGVDQDEGAINVAVVEQALKAAPRRCRKSGKKTEPRVKRGKGTKRNAEEEPEKKDQLRKLLPRREVERQLLLWPTKRSRRRILRRNQMPRKQGKLLLIRRGKRRQLMKYQRR